jgi:hypothetical protein
MMRAVKGARTLLTVDPCPYDEGVGRVESLTTQASCWRSAPSRTRTIPPSPVASRALSAGLEHHGRARRVCWPRRPRRTRPWPRTRPVSPQSCANVASRALPAGLVHHGRARRVVDNELAVAGVVAAEQLYSQLYSQVYIQLCVASGWSGCIGVRPKP